MTRRLVLLAVVAVLALLVYALLSVLERAASAQNAEQQERSASQQVSRSLSRPVLSLPLSESPADHLRVGGDQTSPTPGKAVQTPSARPSVRVPSVAAVGSGVRGGEAATPEPAAQYEALRARIAFCESRNEPTVVNKSSGAAGLYQFLDSTWHTVTGLPGKASDYSAAVQTSAFDKLYKLRGTAPWISSRGCWRR